jgi:hypothetical protein
MKTAIRIFIIATVLIFQLAFVNAPVSAQNGPAQFEHVKLWLYPEYDDPRLLVILEGQISGVEPPAEVSFLVPAAAEMYSAGSIDAEGRYSGGPPDRAPSDIPGWDRISYEVTTDTFRVEYYDPVISGNPDKSIAYEFRTLYPVADMEAVVQEPIGATDFIVAPEGSEFIDGAGFTSYYYKYNDVTVDTTLQFNIDYTRTETVPSLLLGTGEGTGGNGGVNYALVVTIVVVIASAILAAGIIWYRKSAPKTRAEKRRATKKPGGAGREASRSARKYCNQCGKPVDEGYKYCPNCGADIR